jgi:transposase-like protein
MTKDSNAINTDLIDQLLANYKSPEDVLGENGLLNQFTKALLEPALKAQLTHHLGYEKHDPQAYLNGNSRNRKSSEYSTA